MPSLDQRYTLAAPVEAVFSAWVSNETVIAPVTRVDIDPVVGGRFDLYVGEGAASARMAGRILALERDRSIRYTWAWNAGAESIVDVQFASQDGATLVRILHSGLADSQDADRHAVGWDSYIAGLKSLLAD